MVPGEGIRGLISEEGRGSGRSPEVFTIVCLISVAGRRSPSGRSRAGAARLRGRLDTDEINRQPTNAHGLTSGHDRPQRSGDGAPSLQGVKTPTVPRKPLRIITPAKFDAFYGCLPDDMARLMVKTDIESGMRWGELTELRPRDIDFANRIVTVSRTAVEVNPKYHPSGGRFLVKEYPKDKEWRRFRLSGAITAKLQASVDERALAPEDLIFVYRVPDPQTRISTAIPTDLGLTEPNGAGHRYRHGTLSAYAAGPCRCAYCRRAYADYRAERRARGKDQPRPQRRWETDGHIPRRWFRDSMVCPALATAGLDVAIRMQLL